MSVRRRLEIYVKAQWEKRCLVLFFYFLFFRIYFGFRDTSEEEESQSERSGKEHVKRSLQERKAYPAGYLLLIPLPLPTAGQGTRGTRQ